MVCCCFCEWFVVVFVNGLLLLWKVCCCFGCDVVVVDGLLLLL